MWIGLVCAALAGACKSNQGNADQGQPGAGGQQAGQGGDPGTAPQDQPRAAPSGNAGTAPATGSAAAAGGTAGAAGAQGSLAPLAENPAQAEHQGAHRWSLALGSQESDAARDVAMDDQGNVAVTGYYASGAIFGDGKQVEAQAVDVFVSKYGPDGSHRWTAHFGGKGEEAGNAVAFDPEGNLVVVGLFADAMTVGQTPLTAVGSDDIFIAKLGPDGMPLWAHHIGGSDSDAAHDVAVGADGAIYVTGSFKRSMNVAGTTFQSKGNEDVYLLKLDSQGGVLWSKHFGSHYKDFGQRVAVDGRGHVVLLAEFTDDVAFGGETLASMGNRDLAVVKLDADGQHLWSKRFGSPFDEFGLGLAVDPAGNILLTGSYDNEIDFGGEKLVSQGESDVYVAKLSPQGEHVWSRSYGAARADIGHGVATDRYGNVAVIGWFWHEVDFGGGPLAATSLNKDIFLLKLSAKGAHLWSRRFGAEDHDQGRAVAMTANGAIAAVGLFRFSMDLGGATLTSAMAPGQAAPPADAFVAVFGL